MPETCYYFLTQIDGYCERKVESKKRKESLGRLVLFCLKEVGSVDMFLQSYISSDKHRAQVCIRY